MYLIYSKPDCPYCILAKGILDHRDIEYDEIIVGTDTYSVDDFKRDFTSKGIKTVPQIFNGAQRIGGYEDLVAWFKEQDKNESDTTQPD